MGRSVRQHEEDMVAVDARISNAIHGQGRTVRRLRLRAWAFVAAAIIGAAGLIVMLSRGPEPVEQPSPLIHSASVAAWQAPVQVAPVPAVVPQTPVQEMTQATSPAPVQPQLVIEAVEDAPPAVFPTTVVDKAKRKMPLTKPLLSIADARISNSRYSDTQVSSFAVGARVWLHTRVLGGQGGEKIDHVWLREGRVVQKVSLNIGSSNWRTHSYKTMAPSMRGTWVVEARDRQGRVLSRHEFQCHQESEAVVATPMI